MSKLRKPIFSFYYSRLLTWVNAIDEGLNPPCSFNLVSAARNRPSGDPNCELFPQGPIIPVPPSAPLYRPVGTDGNNCAVFPGRNAKRKPPSQRARRPLFPLFRWWLCPAAMPKQHQAVLGSTKTRVQKPVPAILCVYEISNRAGSVAFSAIEYRHVLLRPPWGQAGDKNRNSSETQGG